VLLVRVVAPWTWTFTEWVTLTDVTCCWVTVRVVATVVRAGSLDDSVVVVCAAAAGASTATTAIARAATRGM
jgi:hypothetical protein